MTMGYKKYVTDYDKQYVIKPNGKPGVTAVYKGKYFRFAADAAEIKRAKVLFGSLSVLAVVLAVIPLLYQSVGSHTLYVALPHVISIFPLVHLILGIGGFCLWELPLIRERRDKIETRSVASSAVSACMLGATAVAQAVNCILSGFPLPDVLYVFFLLAASAATGTVFFFRRLLKTEECDERGEKK